MLGGAVLAWPYLPPSLLVALYLFTTLTLISCYSGHFFAQIESLVSFLLISVSTSLYLPKCLST